MPVYLRGPQGLSISLGLHSRSRGTEPLEDLELK